MEVNEMTRHLRTIAVGSILAAALMFVFCGVAGAQTVTFYGETATLDVPAHTHSYDATADARGSRTTSSVPQTPSAAGRTALFAGVIATTAGATAGLMGVEPGLQEAAVAAAILGGIGVAMVGAHHWHEGAPNYLGRIAAVGGFAAVAAGVAAHDPCGNRSILTTHIHAPAGEAVHELCSGRSRLSTALLYGGVASALIGVTHWDVGPARVSPSGSGVKVEW